MNLRGSFFLFFFLFSFSVVSASNFDTTQTDFFCDSNSYSYLLGFYDAHTSLVFLLVKIGVVFIVLDVIHFFLRFLFDKISEVFKK